MKATLATAMTSAATMPPALICHGSTNSPIILPLVAISSIAAIIGAARTPFSTALQYSALIGSTPTKLSASADQRRKRDDAVEGARVLELAVEALDPVEGLADGVGGRSGQHRHGQESGADDAHSEE